MCTLALQNGLYGSSLLSEDNTDDQNRRMISVATALNHHKNILLLTHSAQRYEIADLARSASLFLLLSHLFLFAHPVRNDPLLYCDLDFEIQA